MTPEEKEDYIVLNVYKKLLLELATRICQHELASIGRLADTGKLQIILDSFREGRFALRPQAFHAMVTFVAVISHHEKGREAVKSRNILDHLLRPAPEEAVKMAPHVEKMILLSTLNMTI